MKYFRLGLSFFIHILNSYTATEYSLISTGSSIQEELYLQDILAGGQGDSHIPPPPNLYMKNLTISTPTVYKRIWKTKQKTLQILKCSLIQQPTILIKALGQVKSFVP